MKCWRHCTKTGSSLEGRLLLHCLSASSKDCGMKRWPLWHFLNSRLLHLLIHLWHTQVILLLRFWDIVQAINAWNLTHTLAVLYRCPGKQKFLSLSILPCSGQWMNAKKDISTHVWAWGEMKVQHLSAIWCLDREPWGGLVIPFFTGKVGSKKAGFVKKKNLYTSQDGLESKTSSRSSRLKASTSGSKNGEGSSNFCDKPWRGFLVNWVRSSGAWEPGRDHL